jgi:hypothetical protein
MQVGVPTCWELSCSHRFEVLLGRAVDEQAALPTHVLAQGFGDLVPPKLIQVFVVSHLQRIISLPPPTSDLLFITLPPAENFPFRDGRA